MSPLKATMWNGQPMMNMNMLKKLSKGDCIDLSANVKTHSGDFILTPEQVKLLSDRSIDLCVAVTEKWIWSVGRSKKTGEVFASLGSRFYQNPAYDCLWLR